MFRILLELCRYNAAFERSKRIDRMLKAEVEESTREIKLLLLEGFSEDECLEYKHVIYSNTIQLMTAIIQAMEQLEIVFGHPDRAGDARQFVSMTRDTKGSKTFLDLAAVIMRLWADSAVQGHFNRERDSQQLTHSAQYYFESLDRISQPGYKPTSQDILRTKVQTTGVAHIRFTFKGYNFKMFVGGQRSESHKWFSCFEDVAGIIFTTDISEYDMASATNSELNCLKRSMQIFDSVCNSKWFADTWIFLLLNKTDLFKEKLKKSPLSVYFPEFTGTNTYEEAAGHIGMKFSSLNRRDWDIHIHYTCATDTTFIDMVFDVITDTITQPVLKGLTALI
ncbi:hypothetical protein ScPMuIL_008275 [Solemya velum]